MLNYVVSQHCLAVECARRVASICIKRYHDESRRDEAPANEPEAAGFHSKHLLDVLVKALVAYKCMYMSQSCSRIV